MKILSQYIARRVFRSIVIALISVTSIIMLVDFVENSRDIGADAHIGMGPIFVLTLLKTPSLIEQTIPFVVLFGVMGALFALNKRSELVVFRASGLSAWHFLTPALLVTGVIGCIWSLGVNPLATKAMQKHDALINTYIAGLERPADNDPIWLREGTEFEQNVIYAPRYDLMSKTLYDVEFTVFELNSDGEFVFSARYDAKQARLLPSSYWELTNVVENSADAVTRFTDILTLPTQITAQQIQNTQKNDSLPSFWQLPDEIKKLRQSGFSSLAYQMHFLRLLALPVTLIAMTIIAAAVSMRLPREGGTLQLMLSGGLVGFGVFFIENIVKAFGETGTIPAVLAVWSIPLFVLCCGLAYLSMIEDG